MNHNQSYQPTCLYVFTRGQRKNQVCGKKICQESAATTADKCKKHYVIHCTAIVVERCTYTYMSGKKAGQPCDSAISRKSLSGNYCGKHLSKEIEMAMEYIREKMTDLDLLSDSNSESDEYPNTATIAGQTLPKIHPDDVVYLSYRNGAAPILEPVVDID
jgi:hypothetical protein